MKVLVSAVGFYGQLRQPGEVFEVPDDEEASTWFEPCDDNGQPLPKTKGKKAKPAEAEPPA